MLTTHSSCWLAPVPCVGWQVLMRLTQVAEAEGVPCSDDGLEAIIFTAEGDMRNALNNLQATFAGFKHVTRDNVFKVGCATVRHFSAVSPPLEPCYINLRCATNRTHSSCRPPSCSAPKVTLSAHTQFSKGSGTKVTVAWTFWELYSKFASPHLCPSK
jgi:hypothetical protein